MERPNSPGRSREIAADIDRTRTALDHTLDAIVGKLTPQQLTRDAIGVLRSGSTSIATKLVETAKDHPVPATIVSLGLGMLLWERSALADGENGGTGVVDRARRKASDAGDVVAEKLEPVREKIERVSSSVHDTAQQAKQVAREKLHNVKADASQLKAQAGEQVRRAQSGFRDTMEQQPLILGGIALALGAAAALLIPHTRREDEMTGETRDHLFDRAEEAGKRVIAKGRDVAQTAIDTVRQEAEKQGVTPSDLAEKVRAIGREVGTAAGQEAEQQLGSEASTQSRDAAPEADEPMPPVGAGRQAM